MKVGIITLYGLSNYGNRLQNLAVAELLQRKGLETETIVCEKITIRKLIKILKRKILFALKDSKRYRAFLDFDKKHIKVIHVISQSLKMPTWINDKYDAFFVGSDQVWNPRIRQDEKDTFFLRFTTKEKRFCLSPSIGASQIDKQFHDIYKEGLCGFNHLCCREEQGSNEIRRISEQSCLTLIDPTLALDSEYWRSLASDDVFVSSKYVFRFFLSKPEKDIDDSIKKYANDNKLTIIDILNPNSPYYTKGPSCFISLIDRATMVFTDSFHAVAFSINLNTPFYVFDRRISNQYGKISTRITSLLSIFDKMDRYLGTSIIPYSKDCDFKQTNNALIEQRAIMDNYLNQCVCEIKSNLKGTFIKQKNGKED